MNKPRYSNWISGKIVLAATLVTILLLLGAQIAVPHAKALAGVLLFLSMLALLYTVYMMTARASLSYEGGGVQGRVLDDVLKYLDQAGWKGRGKLLDIGCGSGAMSIKAAKKSPRTLITGLDYWGKGWDYSQRLCEENANTEGVSGRITFRRGDAAALPFLDHTFDAAVSNFTFHEVRSQPDKHKLVLEALRVLKPGACFAFQDIYYARSHYGDIEAFVNALRPYVSEIHFSDTRKPDYAPGFLNTPLVLGRMGLIYGRK